MPRRCPYSSNAITILETATDRRTHDGSDAVVFVGVVRGDAACAIFTRTLFLQLLLHPLDCGIELGVAMGWVILHQDVRLHAAFVQ